MKAFYEWESPWRPNIEAKMAASWGLAATATLVVGKYMPVPLPSKFSAIAMSVCTAMAVYRGTQAWHRYVDKTRMGNYGIEFITIPELMDKTALATKKSSVWLGTGFDWTDVEAQKMHAMLAQGVAQTIGKITNEHHLNGEYWIHGLDKETDRFMEVANLVGHTLLVGTTRVGKTRMMELLIGQAIMRGETVIIIDPKGDHALAENARKICAAMGCPERFVYFHPAHPEKSTPIDPMRNWNRRTELASRVAALIPSETGADPFAAFGWKVLNDIVNGLVATGESPNLVHLKRYIEGGADNLLLNTLRHHFIDKVADWESRSSGFVKKNRDRILEAYIEFYKQIVIHEAQSSDLDGLISTFEHNRDHFQKMVASLIPILSMLTSDPLSELLSPEAKIGDQKHATDMAKIINNNQVLYLGLDSLADGTVGSAIGSIMLADLTAVAGDRYNYGINSNKPVNLFIDEAAEVINQPTIQLMNKGGGALFRVTIATQTFADFPARLGDENKARQVLANVNNQIILRVIDAETQQYIADSLPKIKAKSLNLRYGHGVDAHVQDEYQASYQESVIEEEAEIFPAAMLGRLPPLHFIAKMSGGRIIKGRIPILKD
ncbi:MAG: conjugative transfer system coupling protein TraD [Gallionella sp.]|jgi:conjugal transfer pilus assembly protein TraD|nr:conjugative transfer system coupling protein TraD [Gallionella sp.]MDO9054315.1 conjugative transfer system coupling protein TraD [Gallionella sp.]MDP1594015.1 conjugative transfer system coupling protein TraD [Gallionella sp.]MDP1940355.1 conjugative transfer system coupling protein TraD [Gallionella sp.]